MTNEVPNPKPVQRVRRVDQVELRVDDLSPIEGLETGFYRGDAYCTRVGVFPYTLEDGSVRRELRHPNHVFEEASMQSLRMVPITHGHPEEDVTVDNVADLMRGWAGDQVVQDGRFLKAPVLLADQGLIKDVLENGKVEVSCGYWCELVEESGEYEGEPYDFVQTGIRYNHLAAGIDAGRAGPEVKIRTDSEESKEEDVYVKRADQEKGNPAPQKRTVRIRLDHAKWKEHGILVPRHDMELPEESGEMLQGALAAALDALTAMQAEFDKLKTDTTQEVGELTDERDNLQQELDAKKDELKKVDSKIEELVAERQKVISVATQVLKKDAKDFDGKPVDEVRTEVLAEVRPKRIDALKAQSEDARKMAFDLLVEDALDGGPVEGPEPGELTNKMDSLFPNGMPSVTGPSPVMTSIDELASEIYPTEVEDDPLVNHLDGVTASQVRDVHNARRGTAPLALSKRRQQ